MADVGRLDLVIPTPGAGKGQCPEPWGGQTSHPRLEAASLGCLWLGWLGPLDG